MKFLIDRVSNVKMTIKEYYETLKEKRESAKNEAKRIQYKYATNEISYSEFSQSKDKILATINTYTDCICLLESSHLLDKE